MKKALIFDPYLDTLGGGERYSLQFALSLSRLGYNTEIAWDKIDTLKQATNRFGFDLSSLNLNPIALKHCQNKTGFISKLLFFTQYDMIFFLSDGSLPFLSGRKNIVHFQVPFQSIDTRSLISKIKIKLITKFVYNSRFTARVHEKHFPKDKTFILYPPIDTANFVPGRKTNTILSVARFDSPSHSKRQDILINAFSKLHETHKEYTLILTGGDKGNSDTIVNLKRLSRGLPIKIIKNPSFDLLCSLYQSAKFFWHGAGFQIDDKKNPEKVEHFGMTTVEAMASGAIPVVIAKGGQKEIIKSKSGYLCQSPDQIAAKTSILIGNQSRYLAYQKRAIKRSASFSIDKFFEKVKKLIHS